ncbi:Alpha/Beta hydrolase protein [Kockovaella imperatae]|uniref:Alpha/Beta hydrolase protein n=1 Tax=Kockovaella imperatae TaxID=4999 RepID=A0A1Y1UHP0_9TREE|nr:Alpha/Beta hydrolase protein [Kockovaella imperatae]ORX37047.1 Alpha/Beta hydrolase protein [Kockovaella imperatae]
MASFIAWLVTLYVVWIRRSKEIFRNPDRLRKVMQETYLRPTSFAPPKKLGSNLVIIREDQASWPVYRVSKPRVIGKASPGPNGAMMYLHGGAFFREILGPHWSLIAHLCQETGLDIIVPIYPLLPRPGSDAKSVIDHALDIAVGQESPIQCIAGDSAGGTLALALAQQCLKRKDESKYARLARDLRCVVLLSPWLDITATHPELEVLDKDDPWLGIPGAKVLGKIYAGELALDDPIVSPLFGDIDNLPPLLLFGGTRDILCSDARRLSAKYQGKGVTKGEPGSFESERFTFVEGKDMIHVWPMLPSSEGKRDKAKMVSFINKQIAG